MNKSTPSLLAAASLPRQRSSEGLIDIVDCASRALTIKSKDGAPPLTFVWNHSSRFARRGGCARRSFDSGQTVHAWYRREAGQSVVRKVSAMGASAACGASCEKEFQINKKQ